MKHEANTLKFLTILLIKSSILLDLLLLIFDKWETIHPCTSWSCVTMSKIPAQTCFPSEFVIDVLAYNFISS